MRTIITDSEITENINATIQKPVAYNGQPFPLIDLDHRIFEILLYNIFKTRIETNDLSLKKKYDHVYLMQGVGERGRDCFLTKNGKNVGVIQCKQINKNITKPEVISEIIKFILHYLNDKSLISNPNNFTYYFAVSKGFAETAINFLSNFSINFQKENLEYYFNKLKAKYKAFDTLNYKLVEPQLKDNLKKIKIEMLIPSDINQYLYEHDKLTKNFFKVLTVTDNTLLEGIIKDYLTPILSILHPKTDRKTIDFSFRFKEYLQRSYNYYSSSKTLIFKNEQKKLEDFYYPLNLECSLNDSKKKKYSTCTLKYEDDFIPHFKKVIIIDNGGMGKSTIMKWLFLNVIKQRKGIPIFIELRKLKNKTTILEQIIDELNPIDETFEKEIVQKLIAKGNFIFFFDGYDEIAEEDREFVTKDLQNFISKSSNNLFIMTSRPETALNTFSDFKQFTVTKLERNEAFELIKKIGSNSDKSLRLIKKLEEDKIEHVKEFLQSPLLVSLLYKKFEHRENIPLNLQEFYYEVFEALFQDHDLTKGDSFIRKKKTRLSLTEFFQVLRELGFYTLRKNEIEYNDAILTKYLSEISKKTPHLKFKVSDFIEDIVKSVPLFNKEGLQYTWSHKSFQEYFAAEFICRDTKEKQIEILTKMFNSPQSERYSFVLELCHDIDNKPFKKAIIVPYIKQYIDYYDKTFKEIESKFEIDAFEMDIRKAITFNKSYLIITKRNDILMESIFKAIKNNFDDKNLNDFPLFMSENQKLQMISFADFIIFTSESRNDILGLLYKKKSNLLKSIKNSKPVLKTDLENLYSNNLPDFIIVNNKIDETNKNNIFLQKINQLIINQTNMHNRHYLDIQKCRKFTYEYEKELTIETEDYYFGGF